MGPAEPDRELSSLHGRPSAVELVQAVREFLEAEVIVGTEGRLRYQAKVAANALGMVERELKLGPAQQLEHERALARLGFGDDAELAAAIRRGELDDRLGEVADVVRQSVLARLEVAHPGYR